ncbi:hypothetical protein [Peloplasma aerotolerans]|uniref:DUF304 domain-containing protein n=1 Tax=Peloplasma aerotolerans TaxID=3044389 RepID=A0AAW6U581_9MOLU|nr:hypothetical protein [Mariniplasma sp. M4Ah]MDI6453015.1 hypothetical protein [Mariniplasma sp. M4Ah]
MKKILAKKSVSKMIKSIIVMVLSMTVILQVLMYYNFRFENMPPIIRVVLAIFIVLSIFSMIQIVILSFVPTIIMEYDDTGLYIHKINQKTTYVKFADITNVKATINIWAKPFLVYTAVVIDTDQKEYVVRHLDKMDDVKDIIHHLAFEVNEEIT